jgi:hypothetical protein
MKGKTMKKLIVSVAALACCLAGSAVAQDIVQFENPVPKFVTLPAKPATAAQIANPTSTLPTWTSSFTYSGHTYSYYMVGTAPSTGTKTTVKTFIIPTAVVIPGCSTDPTVDSEDGHTVQYLTTHSPIFAKQPYKVGGQEMGTTQYEDAFQRANFWKSAVKSHQGYHVLLGGPTILPKWTLTPGSAGSGACGSPFGPLMGLMDIDWFDGQANAYISAHPQITPDSLPIFLTDNLYLTEGGCCIGGYHSATGPQAYSQATFVTTVGVFSQNVSALSHEVGEWMDDPGVKSSGFTPVACGILEVGDPEEGFTNYGGFSYPLNGFNYTLQDLVFLEYFGAPATTSVSGWMTFHNNPFHLGVCSNGG